MTEKEFLIHFMNWLNLNKYDGKDLECYIESFLNHYHEEYYEVEFIKKEYEGEVDWEKEHPIEMASMRRKGEID